MAFWKWWTTFVLICIAIAAAERTHNISEYFFLDITYISYIIVIAFLICNAFLSYYSFVIQFYKTKISESALRPVWFWSDNVLTLGMIGTMLGFLIVLTEAFVGVDPTNTEKMKETIRVVSQGMGIAMITTLTGLISSTILKNQLTLLEWDNEKL